MPPSTSPYPPVVEALRKSLGLPTSARELLLKSVTHRSAGETEASESYERLEFLGDRVIDLALADYLFHEHPQASEGALTRLKQMYVSEPALAQAAVELGLAACLITGPSEDRDELGRRARTQSELFEAIVAVIYLTRGLPKTADWLRAHLIELVDPTTERDFKSFLQEHLQEQRRRLPVYETEIEGGPAHARVFRSRVFDDGVLLGEGSGPNKKIAEQRAAKVAVEALRQAAAG